MKTQHIAYGILVVACLYVLSFSVIRNPFPAFDTSYETLREGSGSLIYDALLTSGNLYTQRALHTGFAVATILLLFFVGKKMQLSTLGSSLLACFAALSPTRLIQATTFSPPHLGVVLVLLGVLLLKHKSRYCTYASVIAFGGASATGIAGALCSVCAIILLGRDQFSSEKLALMCILSVTPLLFTGLQQSLFHLNWSRLVPQPFIPVTDLGARSGIGLFELVFGSLGLIFFWKQKGLTGIILGGAFISVAVPSVIPYASLGLAEIIRRLVTRLYYWKWSSHLLRTVTLTVIVCGLLFSSVTHLNTLAVAHPTDLPAYLELTASIPKNTHILVLPPTKSSFVGYLTASEPYVTNAPLSPFKKGRLESELTSIITSRNNNALQLILDQNEITHIVLLEPGAYENMKFILGNRQDYTPLVSNRLGSTWSYRWSTQP